MVHSVGSPNPTGPWEAEMARATDCRQCGGLAAGLAEKCPGCGRWLRKQDFYATRAATLHQDRLTRIRQIRGL